MIVAIRDDDTSFWTNPKEIESLYGKFLKEGGKISLAVIPYSWKQVNMGIEKEFFIDKSMGRKPIYENRELVDYLLEKIREGQIEIMQHGFDHSYGVYFKGEKYFLTKDIREYMIRYNVENYQYLPECVFKSEEELKTDLKLGKELLEDTFKVKVRVFVPPGNALSKESVNIVAKLGMNISGIIEKRFNRLFSLKSVLNYARRVWWKIRYNKPYPFVIDYGTHKELVAYAFTPSTDFRKFLGIFEFCMKQKAPFVLATHYWEILGNKTLGKKFFSFLWELQNVEFLFLSQILDRDN